MTNTNSPSTYGEYSNQMTDELDEYGVWVKSAPQSLDESKTPVLSKKGALSDKTSQTAISEDSGFPADLLKNFLTDIEDIDEMATPINETGQKPKTETLDIPQISLEPHSKPSETTATLPSNSEPANTEKAASMESQNVHADLLARIADQLASIHDELTGIRQEFSQSIATLVLELPKPNDMALIRSELNSIQEELRRKDKLTLIHKELIGIRQELSQNMAKQNPEVGDDDKQIILTRDELGSIFNTARRLLKNREYSSVETPDLSLAEEPLPEPSLISEISLAKKPPSREHLHIVEDADTDEMKKLYEEGVKPLTPAPEDTSYLEEPVKPLTPTPEDTSYFDVTPLTPAPEDTSYLDVTPLTPAPEDTSYFDVTPLTSAPEDTSYLDVTPLTSAPEDTSYLDVSPFDVPDLSNAVIDDPVFPEKIEEHPLEEPSPEYIKNLSLDVPDTAIDTASPDESLTEPCIDDLLLHNDTTNDLAIELDADHLHATYYREEAEEEDELLEFDEYEDEENGAAQDIGELLMAKNWGTVAEETNTDAPHANEPTPQPEPKEEPVKKNANLSQTSISSPEESYENVTGYLTRELKRILSYMDQVLDSLPDDKIEAFTQSEHFPTYKQIFKALRIF